MDAKYYRNFKANVSLFTDLSPERVEFALSKLCSKDRTVVELLIEGLNCRTIAKQMKVSRQAIYQRIRRARYILATNLSGRKFEVELSARSNPLHPRDPRSIFM